MGKLELKGVRTCLEDRNLFLDFQEAACMSFFSAKIHVHVCTSFGNNLFNGSNRLWLAIKTVPMAVEIIFTEAGSSICQGLSHGLVLGETEGPYRYSTQAVITRKCETKTLPLPLYYRKYGIIWV